MAGMRTVEQRRELGAFVRAHRAQLSPAGIGLSAGTRRRTPGLRREEVAQLCGLSTTWYTWIEQGRDVSASPEALARLAGVLRLGRAERAYLFQLAGTRDPDPGGSDTEQVPPGVLACVERIASPAYVLDRTWTARTWNAPAERLFAGWLDRPGDRNLLRFIYLEPAARSLVCDWEARARRRGVPLGLQRAF
jgi:transcriptional regulator with XRE-family HTH domain